jgi:dephospho-CoA kinase
LITLLEDIVHPLVSEDRKKFIQNTKHKINVFDIPLLFETGSNKIMDKVACVFVPRTIQMERLRSRNTMQEAEIDKILKQQMPIEEKCSLSDFVIETYNTLDTELQVVKILREIEGYLNA